MTDREKAIIMAYTGTCMLTGEKFNIFHKYIEEICGRPIWAHELAIENVVDEIKEKSKADFLWLCENSEQESKTGHWIPVSERLPGKSGDYWCTFGGTNLTGKDYYTTESDAKEIFDEPEEYTGWESQNVIAWMPLPKCYDPHESEE